jgi:hypothetical protein
MVTCNNDGFRYHDSLYCPPSHPDRIVPSSRLTAHFLSGSYFTSTLPFNHNLLRTPLRSPPRNKMVPVMEKSSAAYRPARLSSSTPLSLPPCPTPYMHCPSPLSARVRFKRLHDICAQYCIQESSLLSNASAEPINLSISPQGRITCCTRHTTRFWGPF